MRTLKMLLLSRRQLKGAVSLTLGGLISLGGLTLPVKAVRFADGTVHFRAVPSLGKVSTTDNQVWAWSATYLFRLTVPADASEPLGRVDLKQTEGVDSIEFNLKQTSAYLTGNRHQTFKLVATQPSDRALSIEFDPPIPPGTEMTLALRPMKNPQTSGVYLFGVTAFPSGEKVSSQFLGYGRLQFYDSFHNGFFGGWRR